MRVIHLFGHLAYHHPEGIDDPVRWFDNDEEVQYNGSGPIAGERKCPQCNLKQNVDGTDPCLGKLPGVKAACCGHGVQEAYVAFENGVSMHFDSPAQFIFHNQLLFTQKKDSTLK